MIIIDDGSTDHSVTIIQEYVQKDPRIVLLQQENAGSASARNKGIRHANGQYICLLDADDIWELNFLESQIHFLKEKKAAVVFASYKLINEQSKDIRLPVLARPSITYRQMLVTNFIGCLTGLYDRTKYGKIYLREELKSLRDDYAYWLDIMKQSDIAYGNLEILAKYRVRRASTTGKKLALIKAQFAFYKNYLRFGYWQSLLNTVYWGFCGFSKFSK